jgi:hypothetical protein
MIINIKNGVFGYSGIRNGDLVAVCNVVEYLRQKENNSSIQFYLESNVINRDDYIIKFFNFLCKQTNYFSLVPGNTELSWRKVNLWDFRDISGDLVKIQNDIPMKNKVVIFPVYDASYNVYRNWTVELSRNILDKVKQDFPKHERIICCKEIPNSKSGISIEGFKLSTDFMENVNHIMDAEVYIGGDTGMSHFAAALDRGPKHLVYFNSSRGLLHTLPFYLLQGKGELKTYWMDFEGTTWE